jgi:hypothetical protein
MNWSEYINKIYSTVNISISSQERIIIVEKEYLQNLFVLLDKTPTRVVGKVNHQMKPNAFFYYGIKSLKYYVSSGNFIANYIMWRLVRLLSPQTSSKMNNLAINFSKALYGNPQSETR